MVSGLKFKSPFHFKLIFFNIYSFLRDRVRELGRGREREGYTGFEAGSRL